MKAELVTHPTKGICILISGINLNDFSDNFPLYNSVFSDPIKIANEISIGRKIAAIKEARTQTGWGLREAKDYIDKYYPLSPSESFNSDYKKYADHFLKDHVTEEFIGKGDMEL